MKKDSVWEITENCTRSVSHEFEMFWEWLMLIPLTHSHPYPICADRLILKQLNTSDFRVPFKHYSCIHDLPEEPKPTAFRSVIFLVLQSRAYGKTQTTVKVLKFFQDTFYNQDKFSVCSFYYR